MSVGWSGEGFALGRSGGSGEARQGVKESGEGLMMAAHGEQGRRRSWHTVVLFEEAEEGRKGRGGREQGNKSLFAGLNRRRRRRIRSRHRRQRRQ
jgi:hypothetical protein